MNASKMNELVGKSFEDLSIEEMQQLQGSQRYNEQVTPSPLIITAFTLVSAQLSKEVSGAISTLVTAANNCK